MPDPTPPPSRALDGLPTTDPDSLRLLLDQAFEDGGFSARVETGGGDALVSATLLSTRFPFGSSAPLAAAWLEQEAVSPARARLDDAFNVVLDLSSAAAVQRLIVVLLEPHIRAQTTAIALREILAGHRIAHAADVHEADVVALTLWDCADLDTAALFAGLLGAPGISDGLDLSRNRHLRRLADRLTWLATGIAGSPVLAEATPGCAHEPDQVSFLLTLGQARRLARRLDTARPVASPLHGEQGPERSPDVAEGRA
ncbi:hypothetical protein [Streptomyces turgidiscabies]|uniref:hypothetical protein n=1 Tax=Streptomyces turgidiscabies TaxID=85558 RepID=UPI0038F80CC0